MIDKAALVKTYASLMDAEGEFVKVLDQIVNVERNYEPTVTSFLPPDLCFALMQIVQFQAELSVEKIGVFKEAERNRLVIKPEFSEAILDSEYVSLLEIKYNQKFAQLSHRDALGALLSLGVKRNKLGDIIVFDGGFQVAVDKTLETYFLNSVEKIGRAGVTVKSLSLSDAIIGEKQYKSVTGTVKSIRLDSIIALAYNLSRSEAQGLIEGGMVKVNHMINTHVTYGPKEKDLLSVRGHGRFIVGEILGTTKKDRIRINLSVLIQ